MTSAMWWGRGVRGMVRGWEYVIGKLWERDGCERDRETEEREVKKNESRGRVAT